MMNRLHHSALVKAYALHTKYYSAELLRYYNKYNKSVILDRVCSKEIRDAHDIIDTELLQKTLEEHNAKECNCGYVVPNTPKYLAKRMYVLSKEENPNSHFSYEECLDFMLDKFVGEVIVDAIIKKRAIIDITRYLPNNIGVDMDGCETYGVDLILNNGFVDLCGIQLHNVDWKQVSQKQRREGRNQLNKFANERSIPTYILYYHVPTDGRMAFDWENIVTVLSNVFVLSLEKEGL